MLDSEKTVGEFEHLDLLSPILMTGLCQQVVGMQETSLEVICPPRRRAGDPTYLRSSLM